MPTAVERVTQLLDQFIKLDGVDGVGEQTQLNAAFLKIDDALAGRGASSLPDHKYQSAFEVIGQSYLKLGFDFERDAWLGAAIDDFAWKLDTGGSETAQADFLKFDGGLKNFGADLARFGADFLKLGHTASHTDFLKLEAAVADDAGKLSTDAASLGGNADQPGAAAQLGGDLVRMVGVDSNSPLLKIGEALESDAKGFQALSTDFGDLARALLGDGSVMPAFSALNDGFLKLDASFQGLAGPLAGLLLPAVQKDSIG